MNVFVWDDLRRMSTNYHDDGGVVVIAADLEAAHALLRTEGEWGTPVPGDSDIFSTPPTAIYPTLHDAEGRVFAFPNAGCC